MRHYNLNGSSAKRILEDATMAHGAIQEALYRLSHLVPHGRDYQGAPAGIQDADMNDFRSAIAALTDAADYAQSVALHASEQPGVYA